MQPPLLPLCPSLPSLHNFTVSLPVSLSLSLSLYLSLFISLSVSLSMSLFLSLPMHSVKSAHCASTGLASHQFCNDILFFCLVLFHPLPLFIFLSFFLSFSLVLCLTSTPSQWFHAQNVILPSTTLLRHSHSTLQYIFHNIYILTQVSHQ